MGKVFKGHEIRLAMKLRLLDALVMASLLYGIETWSLTTALKNKLNTCENQWLYHHMWVPDDVWVPEDVFDAETNFKPIIIIIILILNY